MNLKDNIVFRLKIVYVVVAIIGVLIFFRIFQLQFISTGYDIPEERDTMSVYSRRGDILSSDSEVLATTKYTYKLSMDFAGEPLKVDSFNKYVDALADSLSVLFPEKTRDEYATILREKRARKTRYYTIKTHASFDEYMRAKKFPIFKLGQMYGGFIVKRTKKRVLPYNGLASRTIGNLRNGKYVGLEGYYDKFLKGESEVVIARRVGNENIPISNYDESVIDSELPPGKDVVTTLDIKLQDYVHQVLLEQSQSIGVDTAAAIVMEVKTGEVKAIVNLIKNSKGEYSERGNFAVAGKIEPGSTVKLASLMAGLESGYYNLYDTVNTSKGFFRGDFKITESSRNITYGKLSVREVFEKSSNIGTALLTTKAFGNNPKEFIERLYTMNLQEKTGIDVYGEPYPDIKSPSHHLWSSVSLAQMSIGYEIMFTPLQVLTFYNAVANNGVMVKPLMVRAIKQDGEVVETFKAKVVKPAICSPATIKKAKLMLEGVVKRGTASLIRTDKYSIAGKTGTAQAAIGTTGYHNDSIGVSHYGSFVGYFPADNPEYSCMVVIKTRNKHKFYGGTIAAPVFRKISDRIYATSSKFRKKIVKKEMFKFAPYSKVGDSTDLNTIYGRLRIPVLNRKKVSSKWIYTNEKETMVEYQNRILAEGKIPNVVGMGLKDAIYLLEKSGLTVKVEGRGTVRRQSLRAGDKIVKGRKIALKLW